MLIKFIISYYKKTPLKMLFGFIMLVAVDIAQLISPRIVQRAIDYIIATYTTSGNNYSYLGKFTFLIFALALVKEPRIIILDEATSSIDSEIEYLIQDAIKKIMKSKSSIAIVHRLSTIQDVDRIYVIHKGKIVEMGNHSQLIAKRGYYNELYKYQYLKT